MTLSFAAEPAPLRVDELGVVRVGATKVTLDTVVALYRQRQSVAQIAADLPDIRLADPYGAIGYYLKHRLEMEAYLTRRRREQWLVGRRLARQRGVEDRSRFE